MLYQMVQTLREQVFLPIKTVIVVKNRTNQHENQGAVCWTKPLSIRIKREDTLNILQSQFNNFE